MDRTMDESMHFGATNEQKKMICKMKYDYENYREIILYINSILKWERQYYPAIIFGAITMLFSFIWYTDLSVLTLASLISLVFILLEFVVTILSKILFRQVEWTGAKEKKYDEICTELSMVKMKLTEWCNYAFSQEDEKTPMFYLIMSGALLFLAYIGAIINNLFLTYVFAMFVSMYPGLYGNGLVQMAQEKVFGCLSSPCHAKTK